MCTTFPESMKSYVFVFILILGILITLAIGLLVDPSEAASGVVPVSYTHLTLPTKRIV